MIPTSSRSLSDELINNDHRHGPLQLHRHSRNFEWTSPDTDNTTNTNTNTTNTNSSESSPSSSPHPKWSNHFHPPASRDVNGPYSCERPRHHQQHQQQQYYQPHTQRRRRSRHTERPRDRFLDGGNNDNSIHNFHHTDTTTTTTTTTTIPTEAAMNRCGLHIPMVTAAVSPMCSNRRTRHRRHYHHPPNQRYKRETKTGSALTSTPTSTPTERIMGRQRKGMPRLSPAFSSRTGDPSLSSSSRNNRIYVRIKRRVVTTEKEANKIPTIIDNGGKDRFRPRVRSDPSSSVPGMRQRMNHHHRRHSKTVESTLSLPFLSNEASSSNRHSKQNPNIDTMIIRPNTKGKNDGEEITDNIVYNDVSESRFDHEISAEIPSLSHNRHRTAGDNSSSNIDAKINTRLQLISPSLLLKQQQQQRLQHWPRHPYQKDLPSTEKILVTESLLELENGPISWSSIREPGPPPESFVSYLAGVLTEGVRVHLEHNPGMEYWIKHVAFWSDILDPESRWWNTAANTEGSLYKGIVERLRTSLNRRWGGSGDIGVDGLGKYHNNQERDRVSALFLRACILFALKSSNKTVRNHNHDNGRNDRDRDH